MQNVTTPAHFQTLALRETLRLWFPEHQPRTHDPHYRLFNAAKRRMKQLDVPCWRCGVHYADLNDRPGGSATARNPLAASQLEAHHQDIEFSLANAVDVDRWWDASLQAKRAWWDHTYSNLDGFLKAHPELDPAHRDEVFNAYVESEGNLQQLCDVCHRSKHQGIHHIPGPEWRPLAIWRQQLPAHIQPAA